MGGTFNDDMMAENERVRARSAQERPAARTAPVGAPPVPGTPPPAPASIATPAARSASGPAPRPAGSATDTGLSRTGRRVMVVMVLVAAVAVGWPVIAATLGSIVGSDGGSEAAASSVAVSGADVDGVPIAAWEVEGFAFDAPSTWGVDTDYEEGVVRLWTEDGDLIELRDAGRLSGDVEPTDQAFEAAFQLYDQRLGLGDGNLDGWTFVSPHADVAVELSGAEGEVAVMVGLDGSMWATVHHRDSAELDPAVWDLLVTSVRPV